MRHGQPIRQLLTLAGLLAAAVAAQPAEAQGFNERALMSRRDLDSLLRDREQYSQSGAYGPKIREQAALEAALLRQRLTEGDFQVGDQVVLSIESPVQLNDTLTVRVGRMLVVPDVGQIPLTGILRAELEEHLRTSVARYLREPVLHATSHIRLSVMGEVSNPGFYLVPSEALVSDVLMLAGGPRETAEIKKLRVERSGRIILIGDPMASALAEGQTLDQLNIRAGDQFFVGKKSGGLSGAEGAVRVVTLILSLPLAIFAVTQIF